MGGSESLSITCLTRFLYSLCCICYHAHLLPLLSNAHSQWTSPLSRLVPPSTFTLHLWGRALTCYSSCTEVRGWLVGKPHTASWNRVSLLFQHCVDLAKLVHEIAGFSCLQLLSWSPGTIEALPSLAFCELRGFKLKSSHLHDKCFAHFLRNDPMFFTRAACYRNRGPFPATTPLQKMFPPPL